MNPTDTSATPPPAPELKRLTPAGAVDALLKRPMELLVYFTSGKGFLVAIYLIFAAIFCLLLFGAIVGWFSYEKDNADAVRQLWAAPAKITVGLFLSAVICLPSLYIFGCLSGLDLKLGSTVGVLVAAITLSALLLMGFTPVVWIFAQSTDSTVFMGILLVTFWCIALFFAAWLIYKSSAILGGNPKGHLTVWVGIFALVTIQMTTTLRPIIGTSEDLLPGTEEKMFFLEHWGKALDEAIIQANSRGWE